MAELSDFIPELRNPDFLKQKTVSGRARFARREVLPYLKQTTPVDTGEWRDSWEVRVSGGEVIITSTDPAAAVKEYGSEDTPAHAVLAKAVEHFRNS